MNTHDIVVKAAKASGVSQKATKAVIAAAIAAMIDGLTDGDRITLHGLGTLYAVARSPKRRYDFKVKKISDQPTVYKIKVDEAKEMRRRLCQLVNSTEPAVQAAEAPQNDPTTVPEE